MLEFADAYGGELTTETMLVAGVNDNDACVG
jgi:wyosine [tRNA(Phe)-imidazoG37] synthetase (radical SAM superfamily)